MLPQGTEPLVLADGTRINPIDGAVIEEEVLVEVPNTEQIKREIVASRKRISDLPVPPGQMNTLSVVISYSLFGISDEDISSALLIPLEQLQTIKSSDEYTNLQGQFIKNILESDLSDVRGLFVERSRSAANLMIDTLENQDNSAKKKEIREEIRGMCKKFPILESFV